MTLSSALTEEAVRRMLDTARSLYDYVLIDSPAGLGAGFRMACCGPTGPSSSPPTTLLPFGTPSAPWVSWTFCGRFIW